VNIEKERSMISRTLRQWLCVLMLASVWVEISDAQQHFYTFLVHARKFIPVGQPGGPGFVNFFVEVQMTVPDVQNGWGEAKYYAVSDPNHNPHHSNCHGAEYPYATITIDPTWHEVHPIYGPVDGRHTKFFFDWVYEDYTKPATLDYSQNCHGYAFDKGDWPDSASYLISGVPFAQACYIGCYPNEAVVASDTYRHSMKVTGTMCQHPYIPPLQVPKYVTSAEQYATNGTYTRANGCPNGLDIGWAHRAEKWDWQPNWTPTYFSGYKVAP
jgi:hypothetical protein